MAVIVAQGESGIDGQQIASFQAVWDHYLRSGFLYPAKVSSIAPLFEAVRSRWDRLLAATEDVFQLHVAVRAQAIASSHCLVRDTDEGYMIQHASSEDNPHGMLACALSILRKLDGVPRTGFACMYFRPEQRWTSRFVSVVNEAQPPELTSVRTREYLVRRPPEGPAVRTSKPVVEVVDSADDNAIHSLMRSATNPLNLGYEGFSEFSLAMPALDVPFDQAGLVRARRMFVARREGRVVGAALRYFGDVLNLSLLCHRVELFVPDGTPDRFGTVQDLVVAAIEDAAARREEMITLLVDPVDAEAAVAAGFSRTGRRYSQAVWGLESGTSAGYEALAAQY